jgi:hypothetical protein
MKSRKPFSRPVSLQYPPHPSVIRSGKIWPIMMVCQMRCIAGSIVAHSSGSVRNPTITVVERVAARSNVNWATYWTSTGAAPSIDPNEVLSGSPPSGTKDRRLSMSGTKRRFELPRHSLRRGKSAAASAQVYDPVGCGRLDARQYVQAHLAPPPPSPVGTAGCSGTSHPFRAPLFLRASISVPQRTRVAHRHPKP